MKTKTIIIIIWITDSAFHNHSNLIGNELSIQFPGGSGEKAQHDYSFLVRPSVMGHADLPSEHLPCECAGLSVPRCHRLSPICYILQVGFRFGKDEQSCGGRTLVMPPFFPT